MKSLVSLLALMFFLGATVGCGSPKANKKVSGKSQSSQSQDDSGGGLLNDLDLGELEKQVDEILKKIDFEKIAELVIAQVGKMDLEALKQLARDHLTNLDVDLEDAIKKIEDELAALDLSQPGAQEKKERLEKLLEQLKNAKGGLPDLLDRALDLVDVLT